MRVMTIIAVVLAAVIAGVAGASAAAHSSTASTASTVSTGATKLGRILVDGRGRSLYLFERDKSGRSACAGACAVYWPPVLAKGTPTAGRGVKTALLGITRRADGTRQVTYAGHPLYRYVQDTAPGQTTGQDLQDFGAGWYVLSPDGKKIEKDAS